MNNDIKNLNDVEILEVVKVDKALTNVEKIKILLQKINLIAERKKAANQ